jgi:hypothetical protein
MSNVLVLGANGQVARHAIRRLIFISSMGIYDEVPGESLGLSKPV